MSSGLPLDYLVEVIAELESAKNTEVRRLETLQISGESITSEIKRRRLDIDRIRAVALNILKVELADLRARGEKGPLSNERPVLTAEELKSVPDADKLLEVLVDAAESAGRRRAVSSASS